MWKETIVCVVIISVIVVANIITQNYTVNSVETLTEEIGKVKELALKLDEDETKPQIENEIKEKMDKTNANWHKRHDKLAYFIEHDELEKVETYFTGINSCLETKEYGEAISEIEKAIFVLKHIEDKYSFSLENIF